MGVGLTWSYYLQGKGSTLPIAGALIRQFGSPDTVRERFESFRKLHAAQQQLAFGVGGKQLTAIEKEVVFKNIPTGDEDSIAEYKAKEDIFRRYVAAHRLAALELAKMPRMGLTPEPISVLTDQAIRRAKEQAGVSNIETDKTAWKSFMSPSERAKAKYLQGSK